MGGETGFFVPERSLEFFGADSASPIDFFNRLPVFVGFGHHCAGRFVSEVLKIIKSSRRRKGIKMAMALGGLPPHHRVQPLLARHKGPRLSGAVRVEAFALN